YNYDLRRRRVFKVVIRDNGHSAAGVDRMSCLGNGIKAEWRIRASGNHDILENFPRSGEIDHHRAFRKKEADRDAALRGGRKRVPFAVLSATAASTSRSDRI